MIDKSAGAAATIKFEPPLPCTTQDCPREATVGQAYYVKATNAWELYPLCKECTERLVRKYEGDCLE